MSHFEALIYGLVQGVTEYLPVSSSAHLLLLPHVLGEKDPGLAFDVFLHLGTLLATTIYFFGDWFSILKTPFPKKAPDGELLAAKNLSWIHLIIGTIPAVVVGLLLNKWIEAHTRSLVVLWVTIPVFGILLWWVDKIRPRDRIMKEATYFDMLVIGCMQTLALVPGVSRSGSTMTAARLRGFNRPDSARISFLLSMPVTLGAIVYECRHWQEIADSVSGVMPLVIGAGSAMIFGGLAIHLMIKWVSKTSFAIFAVYRVVLAILIAVFLGAE